MSQDLHRWKECIPDEDVTVLEDGKLNPVGLSFSKRCIESWQLDWYQVFGEWYSQSFEDTIITNTLFEIAIMILVFEPPELVSPGSIGTPIQIERLYLLSGYPRDGRTIIWHVEEIFYFIPRNVVLSSSCTHFLRTRKIMLILDNPQVFWIIWEIFYQLHFKTVCYY